MSEPNDASVTQEVAIQPAAQAEIIKLRDELVAKANAFEDARAAFNEFIHAVRISLSISDQDVYDIRPDASAFFKAVANEIAETTEDEIAKFYELASMGPEVYA